MGWSRRQFTKEFKLAAVRRVEQGVSIGEAARALEVNPNVLHRWRREFRQGPGNVFNVHLAVAVHILRFHEVVARPPAITKISSAKPKIHSVPVLRALD